MAIRNLVTNVCSVALLLAVQARPPLRGMPPQEPRPSSFVLIDRALEAGAIDAETAHKFRVFAAYGDTRLPAAYRGDDRGMRAVPPSVDEVGALLPTFSAATQAELAPFFMRPDEPGSWVTLSTVPGQEPGDGDGGRGPAGNGMSAGGDDLDPGEAATGSGAAMPAASTGRESAVAWQNVPAAGGKARVWWQDRYPSDAAIAQGLAGELTARIWGKLTGLMAVEPYPDNGIANNGGDAAFDFYLVHAPAGAGWAAQTRSAIASAPCHAARYVVIDTRSNALGSAQSYGVLQIATHELMHAITFAYRVRGGCPELWIGEASGDWASNWVYPLTDGEHQNATVYLETVEYPIDGGAGQRYNRFYGEHLLPYFLENATGGPGFMPAMWSSFRTLGVLEGIDGVVPGGFEKTWPKFLVQLWNRPPTDAPDGFKAWDRLPLGAVVAGGLDVVDIAADVVTRSVTFLPADPLRGVLAPGVQPIAGHYRHYKFERPVRMVTFRNTIREEGILHGSVWAIENIGGSWKAPVDLTEELTKAWCRDEPAEDLQELVLIFGNHDWKDRQTVSPREAPTVEARRIGCAGWTGTSTAVMTLTSRDPAITVVETVNTTIRFEVDSTLITPGLPPEHWISVGGHISWRARVTGKCTGSASGGLPIPRLPYDHVATLSILMIDGKLRHSGASGPWPEPDIPRYTIDCPEGPSELTLYVASGIFATDTAKDELAPDGRSFSGRHTHSFGSGVTIEYHYSFRCSRGC
jgi:hypothetical protein